jgi:two-component system, NarL family, nitrate/nitrite response regulator NarL
MRKVRVLVLEENRILLDSIAEIIDREPDLKAVKSEGISEYLGQAADGGEPDVVILDLGPRNKNGVQQINRARDAWPQVRIVGMGIGATQREVVEYIETGVSGFVMKEARTRELLSTVREVAEGGKVLPVAMTAPLFVQILEQAGKPRTKKTVSGIEFTRREADILALVSEGLTNKEIARRLDIGFNTVKSHVHNILHKCQVRSRVELALLSQEVRLLSSSVEEVAG